MAGIDRLKQQTSKKSLDKKTEFNIIGFIIIK